VVDVTTFFLTFVVVAAVVLALAIGVIFGRKPIAGSCGGNNGGESDCGCRKPCTKRLGTIQEKEAG